ncbi:MAG TPA: hypothetical protein VNK94_00355 [Gaiellaceae bacterium]|nr:hypothetical protein [Gaiellaceae bacterium]
MNRVLAIGLAVAGALSLGAADGAGVRLQNPMLVGTVGPGFAISVKTADGSPVTALAPGTYELAVDDLAEEHSFHLQGPGVDRATTVAGTGKETWTVTLAEGRYVFFCDAHPLAMRGSFVAGSPPPPPPPPPAIAAGSRLLLTSGPGFSITLTTAAGKPFRALERGSYTVVVRDRSRIHSAHLVAPGFDRRTGIPALGRETWKVRLARVGTLRFFCDAHPASMRGSRKVV